MTDIFEQTRGGIPKTLNPAAALLPKGFEKAWGDSGLDLAKCGPEGLAAAFDWLEGMRKEVAIAGGSTVETPDIREICRIVSSEDVRRSRLFRGMHFLIGKKDWRKQGALDAALAKRLGGGGNSRISPYSKKIIPIAADALHAVACGAAYDVLERQRKGSGAGYLERVMAEWLHDKYGYEAKFTLSTMIVETADGEEELVKKVLEEDPFCPIIHFRGEPFFRKS